MLMNVPPRHACTGVHANRELIHTLAPVPVVTLTCLLARAILKLTNVLPTHANTLERALIACMDTLAFVIRAGVVTIAR